MQQKSDAKIKKGGGAEDGTVCSLTKTMTEAGATPTSELALGLVVSLSALETDDLVRLTLQKPDITRIFASALHTLATAKVASLSTSSSSLNDKEAAALAIVHVLSRLIERGDPSLARTFLPTHGSLVDLCVVAHNLASTPVKNILDHFLDATAVEDILKSLLAQLKDSALVEVNTPLAATSVRTSSSLLLAFLTSCPSRPLHSLDIALKTCLETCLEIYDFKLKIGDQFLQQESSVLTDQDVRLLLLAAKVDLMQIGSILLQTLRPLPQRPMISELDRSASLLQEGDHEAFIRSTILVDISTTDSWPTISQTIRRAGLPPSSMDILASIDHSASRQSSFSGAAWVALQALAEGPAQPASTRSERVAVSEDILTTVDSILPHYGLVKLRTILSRDSFRGQDLETILQRLLEGDEGGDSISSNGHRLAEPVTPPSVEPLPPKSRIKSRATLFGDSALGAPTSVQLKQRPAKVEELPPELKAAILARAEAADGESDAEEEWNPFAEPHRTVGVEDELDLDFEGRERSVLPRQGGDEHDSNGEEDPSRARERTLIRHYVQSGSASFSADQGIRRSANRNALKDAIGWSDDLIESWGIMFERNPMKDRLLAAATDAELDHNLPNDDSDSGDERPRWGIDRGRGGRLMGARGGGRGQGVRGGTSNATRGKGTGNSGTDRAAKHKEKQGNKARQRGHDKKMARVHP